MMNFAFCTLFCVLIFMKIETSECGLPNDHFGGLTSVNLVLIIKNKLGSAQIAKLGRLLVEINSSASIP